MEIRGTQTEKNLVRAFVGESQANSRYAFFAEQAQKDGFVAIARIFAETARQEEVHARCFFACLQGGKVEISMIVPAASVADVRQNLKTAIKAEREEWTELYPKFAEEARSEGFDDIANRFQSIAFCERQHELRFAALLKEVESGSAFRSVQPIRWRCLSCGYVHEGTEAPALCPACDRPQAWYEKATD